MQIIDKELPVCYRNFLSGDKLKLRLMSSNKPSLTELNMIGRSILEASTADLCLSGLFIHHWETMSLCDVDETLAQMVSEIGDAILRKIRNELDHGRV
ncbi:hypothetical protein K1X84_00875 [bacterium]|nr:hypothetical protein [bacterium]